MRRKPLFFKLSWHRRGLLLALAGLLLFASAARVQAGDERILLLTTTSLKTTRFEGEKLGAGFFGTNPNYGPSDAIVSPTFFFRGHPVETAPGTPALGSADMVIELLGALNFQGNQPESKFIDARIEALDLSSAEPLTVTYQGAHPEQWNVRLCLTRNTVPVPEQPTSYFQFTNDCGASGTFKASIGLKPRWIFSRVSDGLVKILDASYTPVYSFTATGFWTNRSATQGEFLAVPAGALVDRDCDQFFEPAPLPATSEVILGLARVGCTWLAPQQGYLALHPIVETMATEQSMLPTPQEAGTIPFPLTNSSDTPER
jgi:hypothetical protein